MQAAGVQSVVSMLSPSELETYAAPLPAAMEAAFGTGNPPTKEPPPPGGGGGALLGCCSYIQTWLPFTSLHQAAAVTPNGPFPSMLKTHTQTVVHHGRHTPLALPMGACACTASHVFRSVVQ